MGFGRCIMVQVLEGTLRTSTGNSPGFYIHLLSLEPKPSSPRDELIARKKETFFRSAYIPETLNRKDPGGRLCFCSLQSLHTVSDASAEHAKQGIHGVWIYELAYPRSSCHKAGTQKIILTLPNPLLIAVVMYKPEKAQAPKERC